MIALALMLVLGLTSNETACAENYRQRVAVAKDIARLQRLADRLWPEGKECNMRCAALEAQIGRLLDDQLMLEAEAESLKCPLHPAGQ